MSDGLTRRTALILPAAAAVMYAAGDPAHAQPPPAPAPARRKLFNAQVSKLPNGLTLAHIPRPGSPVAVQMLWVKAGGLMDRAGRGGTAHFIEHMMFKGTPTVPSGEFSRRVSRLGGSDNAFTSLDVTAYHEEVAADDLATVMRMDADRFVHALLPQAELNSERRVILEERRMRTESSPRARFRETLSTALWGSHLRGRPVIGSAEDINAITRSDLAAFQAAHYAPGNAVLVVLGGADVRKRAEEIYGPIPARSFTARTEAAAPTSVTEARIEKKEAGLSDPMLSRVWIAPGLNTAGRQHVMPLNVLNGILDSGPGGRLHRTLVASGLANNVWAAYDDQTSGWSEFAIGATPRPGVEPAKLESALQGLLSDLIDNGPTEEETARAIRQATAGALLALDSVQGAAQIVGSYLAADLPLDIVEYWPESVGAVTRDAVHAALRDVLGKAPNVTGWVMPA